MEKLIEQYRKTIKEIDGLSASNDEDNGELHKSISRLVATDLISNDNLNPNTEDIMKKTIELWKQVKNDIQYKP